MLDPIRDVIAFEVIHGSKEITGATKNRFFALQRSNMIFDEFEDDALIVQNAFVPFEQAILDVIGEKIQLNPDADVSIGNHDRVWPPMVYSVKDVALIKQIEECQDV